jgi:hypothetical protein
MRNLKSGILCLALFLCYQIGSAQTAPPVTEPDYNKPKLFADLPDRISIRVNELEQLLSRPVGGTVSVNLGSSTFNLEGTIVSAASKYNGTINSVVVKAANRGGAVFSFSKTISENGAISYAGRIISLQHGDCYLINNENGQYYLQKKRLYEVFSE